MKYKCKSHNSDIECKECKHNGEHDLNLTCSLQCCKVLGKNVRCIRMDL